MEDFFNNLNWIMLLKAFVVGGLICIIGQILIDKTKLTSARILVIFVTVFESLHDTLGNTGVPKYSPTKASICFLIRGINSTEVGFPIPQFSSKERYYSASSLPL